MTLNMQTANICLSKSNHDFEDRMKMRMKLWTLYPKNFVTCAKSSKAKFDGVSDGQNWVDSADNIHSAA